MTPGENTHRVFRHQPRLGRRDCPVSQGVQGGRTRGPEGVQDQLRRGE